MTRYTLEEKMEIVLRVLDEHESMKTIAKELRTSPEHIRRWVKRYQQFGIDELSKKNG